MSIIKKILIPFNFSITSQNALNYALYFANDKKEVEINLLHIVKNGSDDSIKRSRKKLDNIVNKSQKLTESKVKFTIIEDELVSGIIEYKSSSDSDIILMGTDGTQHEENTNTSELIRSIDSSVIVVPNTYKKFKLKRIAVSLDKKKIDDSKVLNLLLDTTRRFNSKVLALTILNENDNYTEIDESNEKLLKYYLENFYSHHSLLKESDIERGIFAYVKENKIDLLTILPRHHSNKNIPSEGKLVNALAKHAKIPLLILD